MSSKSCNYLIIIVVICLIIEIQSISLLNAYHRLIEKEKEPNRKINNYDFLRPVASVDGQNILPRSSHDHENDDSEIIFDENGATFRVPKTNIVRISDIVHSVSNRIIN